MAEEKQIFFRTKKGDEALAIAKSIKNFKKKYKDGSSWLEKEITFFAFNLKNKR